MSMKNDISIIVPIFNAEQYLDCCIKSIVTQTYQKIELILIDDGSCDKSSDICKKWGQKDSRIRYIYQENQGVSVARNRGMKEARGDYITFIDADDYVCDTYCEELLEILLERELDILYCEATSFSPEGEMTSHGYSRAVYVWKGTDYEYDKPKEHRSAWGVIYRTSVIKGLDFPKDIYVGEDAVFFARAVCRAGRIGYYDASLYYYRVLENSAYHGSFDKKKYTEIEAWRRICKVFEDWPLTKLSAEAKFAETCNYLISRYLFDPEFDETVLNEVIGEYRKNLSSLIKYDLIKRKIPIKHMIKGLFPHAYVFYLYKKLKWKRTGKKREK